MKRTLTIQIRWPDDMDIGWQDDAEQEALLCLDDVVRFNNGEIQFAGWETV